MFLPTRTMAFVCKDEWSAQSPSLRWIVREVPDRAPIPTIPAGCSLPTHLLASAQHFVSLDDGASFQTDRLNVAGGSLFVRGPVTSAVAISTDIADATVSVEQGRSSNTKTQNLSRTYRTSTYANG